MNLRRWHGLIGMRLRSLTRRGREEQALEKELRFHLERQTEENRASGMSPDEARYAACAGWAAWHRSRRNAAICDARITWTTWRRTYATPREC